MAEQKNIALKYQLILPPLPSVVTTPRLERCTRGPWRQAQIGQMLPFCLTHHSKL